MTQVHDLKVGDEISINGGPRRRVVAMESIDRGVRRRITLSDGSNHDLAGAASVKRF